MHWDCIICTSLAVLCICKKELIKSLDSRLQELHENRLLGDRAWLFNDVLQLK